MKIIFLFFTFFNFHFLLNAQNCNESNYNILINQAENAKKSGDIQKVINSYNSAIRACPLRRRLVENMRDQYLSERNNNQMNLNKSKSSSGVSAASFKEKPNQGLTRNSIESTDSRSPTKAESLKNAEATSQPEADSLFTVYSFKAKNLKWLNKMTANDQNNLLRYIVHLKKSGRNAGSDTLAASLYLWQNAKEDNAAFAGYLDSNLVILKKVKFQGNKLDSVSNYPQTSLDILYYWGLEKIAQAQNLLPSYSKEKYDTAIQSAGNLLESHRESVIKNFLTSDTLIQLSTRTLFTKLAAGSNNFCWSYLDYEDYRKLQVRFLNLSLDNFSFTTDSLLTLTDAGRFYNILATAPNFRYSVVKAVDYALKKNKAEYNKIDYADPAIVKLVDRKGNTLADFSSVNSTSYFFSPDANFIATWKSDSLLLYDINAQKYIDLPDAYPAPTESFSSDAKNIAYYNATTKTLYFFDLANHNITAKIPLIETSVRKNIENIDFTGNNSFFKINTADSIYLFNIKNKKIILRYRNNYRKSDGVKDIVVSPNNKDILLTCRRVFKLNGNSYNGYLTFWLDMQLNLKGNLYTDCDNFFFTPDGKSIIGYNGYTIARWPTDKSRSIKTNFQSCLSLDELIDNGCLSYDQYRTIEDARQLENGARKLKSMAEEQTDPILRRLYYRQSQDLFKRLAYGHAKNIRQERIPFFYDWYSWIDRVLGFKNFNEQFARQQTAVEIFDKLINSPDSVYPQQLFYAANGNMLLGNLFDSLRAYNPAFANQIKKEISLREKVFSKDPDNADNTYYIKTAFKRLSAAYDSIGWQNLITNQYPERLQLFKTELTYLDEKIKTLPDSFDLKTVYIDALAQLAPSFLYVYANNPKEYVHALDSTFFYADKALALSSDKFDSARLLIVKARAYLLKEDGVNKSLELYRFVRNHFPGLTKESMLRQLQFLKEAVVQNPNIRRIEEFLRQE